MNSATSHFNAEHATLPTTAEREYRQRLEAATVRQTSLESRDRKFVRVRIVSFVAIIFVGAICIGDASVGWYWLLLPVSLFVAVLRLHQPVTEELRRSQASCDFYQQNLRRLSGAWRDFKADGAAFRNSQHPWADDLDIFGPGSVFQKLNQCRMLPSQRKLATWLTEIADCEIVRQRQAQAESLKSQTELRERLATIDDHRTDWQAAERLLTQWASEPALPFSAWTLWATRLLAIICGIVILLVMMTGLTSSAILLVMLLQAPFAWANRRRIQDIMQHMDSVDLALRQLAEILYQMESFPFDEPSLLRLQRQFTADNQVASERIHELSNRIQWLNNALRNQFFLPLAWMFGLFIHLPHQVETWRLKYGHHIPEWLDAVTSLEVILSVAAFNYEQETYCLPKISPDHVQFSATALGHPLLDPATCVGNDVSLTADRPLMLISGSNMSGKSTLLRSVGTNLVLAYCGCRVNASSFAAYPFQAATAMRVSDSLQEGRSLFMSVLRRLKAVVDLTSQPQPVLFLLDEILSGTNSHDRLHGAEAVIRSLVQRGALGMVTTHDLALTKIVDSMEGKGFNMHFEDQVTDGHMTFDYHLREGVVQRSNAIELMRMIGLDV
ncbi:MAG: hypothetical protein KDA81_18495 [Planctomycetaceae bacterium]|nr:hypothetical protein [Planctomycetaceae bacterium]